MVVKWSAVGKGVHGGELAVRWASEVMVTAVSRQMEEKSLKALGEIEFLKKYTGILMHDHETAMYHFGTGHGECNVHLLRYLKKNTEETGNSWSGKMSGLLTGIHRARKEAVERGEKDCGEGW